MFQEPPYGLPDAVHRYDHHRVPMSLDYHPIWLVCQLGVPPLLQEEYQRYRRWDRHIR